MRLIYDIVVNQILKFLFTEKINCHGYILRRKIVNFKNPENIISFKIPLLTQCLRRYSLYNPCTTLKGT